MSWCWSWLWRRCWCSIRYRFWLTCRLWLCTRCWLWKTCRSWLWYWLWFRNHFWFWLWYRLRFRYCFWFWLRFRNSLWLWYRSWVRYYFWFWRRFWVRYYFWLRYWLWVRHYFWLRLWVWCRIWEWLWLRCRLWVIHLHEVIVHISWRFNRSRNWVVVWEWSETFQLCISNASIWLSYLRFCNNISITSCDQVPSVVSFTSRSQWRIWCVRKWFCKSFSNLGFIVYKINFFSIRLPTSNNERFASSSFVDLNMVVTVFAVYFCNFRLISLPLFPSLIDFTCVNECVFRYILCTNITWSKVAYLWWVKCIEFRYSWAICIHDFRNTFHIIVVGSTLKFDKFLSNNTFTKDTWSFLSCICCRSYRFVTSNVTVSWSCELLTCKTCLSVACKNCFISSWCVCFTFCVLATVNDFIVSCLISFRIRNRSLNVWFVFIFVTWVVGITNLKCFVLKVSIYQWEGYVTWISSVSTCIS